MKPATRRAFGILLASAVVVVGGQLGKQLGQGRRGAGRPGVAHADGETIVAASLLQADVQKAVDAAGDGCTVKLPAGTATWSSAVTVSGKFIAIVGAGVDKTIIVGGEYPPSRGMPSHRIFTITTKAGGLTRLTEMTLDGGAGAKDDYNKGMVALGGASSTWRIDHLRIRATRTCAMHVYASGGVVDHCRFELVGWIFGIYGFNGGGGYGDTAWSEDAGIGGPDKPFFIEDNVFSATERSVALDGWAGERVVFRHNTLDNCSIGNHGTETSGRLRGARSFEIYENTFRFTGATHYTAVGLRSGTGVIFGNRASGDVSELLRVDNYRDFGSFRPWGAASGENPFDKNDVGEDGKPVVYETGTHTGPDGARTLSVAGRRWEPDQWRGYSLSNTATGKSSVILSNTRDEIVTRYDDTHGGPNLTWRTGDPYKIQRCVIALDQFGRGKGRLITGDEPTPVAWPEQASEPAYVWDNTLNGRVRGLVSGSPRLTEGVDFYNAVPKPGYTPYTYPHPLVSGGPADGGTGPAPRP
jgi:hypothetical protein